MKFELNAKDGIEQKPTFVQFCKNSIGKKLPERFYIQKIWLPNQYPSATLETESFRIRISSKSSTWEAIAEQLHTWNSECFALAITEISTVTFDYTLEVVETEECIWTPLGEFGMELTITDKPKRKRKPLA